jgi:plastocyanin
MANGGATAVAGASSAAMGLGGGAGNLSATTSATGATNTAGVIGQSGQIPVWVVKVGSQNNDLVFSPNTINGKPGEVVQFQFYSRVSTSQMIPLSIKASTRAFY